MCQENNTIKKLEFEQLTLENRILIEHLYNKQKKNYSEIGKELGKHRSTISREIQRGLVTLLNSDLSERVEYSSVVGQKKKDKKGRNKGPDLKIGKDRQLSEYIEEKIRSKFSPEVICEEIKHKEQFETKISFKTIYNYIEMGVLLVEKADLTYGSYRKKTNERKRDSISRLKLKKGRTINDRPKEVEEREELGHWEMDLVEGTKKSGGKVLLVLSERSSRKEKIVLLPDKSQNSVISAIDKIERQLGVKNFRETFKTITTDNGSEFLNYEGIERSYTGSKIPRTKQYYANAYSSWQRGTNENINKMIRRFLPKGLSFKDVTKNRVKEIEDWINNYPRKMFNFKSSTEIYKEMKMEKALSC